MPRTVWRVINLQPRTLWRRGGRALPSTTVPLAEPGGAVVFPPMPPIEVNDTLAAIEAVRRLPFIDGKRVAVMGGSHGGYVMSKVISRADLRGGILCSPAIFDLIELWKAREQKVDMVQVIKNKI